jgi:hypothetical protein
MTIHVEVNSDQLEVRFSDTGQPYLIDIASLICDAASEPYRRSEARRWFAGALVKRPMLTHIKGRPC